VAELLWLFASEQVHCENLFDRLNDQLRVERTHPAKALEITRLDTGCSAMVPETRIEMATYVLAEAADGYRVVFSLAELDAGIADSEVLVADAMDGTPLGDAI
jgi:hypothetical protein